MTAIRWGVAGPGGIATRFADAMTLVDGGEIVAVASRDADRAATFAARYGIARSYGDYRGLADDPAVDTVYVATPHARHLEDTLLYLAAGKHVLCEKPMALNAAQASRMVAEARERGLFLMEAIWSRFLPAYRALAEVLGTGRIGQPLHVEGAFSFRLPFSAEHRLFDPALGGGALLDLGIYPLQLCSFVLGQPDRVHAEGAIGASGVDEHVVAVLHHPGDVVGVAKAAIRVDLGCEARISGSDGWVDLPAFMHCPNWLTVGDADGIERIDLAYEGDGLRFEVAEVHRCLAAGHLESPVMPLDESISLVRTMDAVRARLGLVYPGEQP